MKLAIEESVLRQVLDAIGAALSDDKPYLNKCRSSYAAIESALDAAEKVEPVAWLYKDTYGKLKVSQIEEHDEHDFPVFTHPAPAVPEKQGPVTEPSDWDINSMDATVWAKAFAERFTVWSQEHGVESDTFGLMVGWFANAIMAGYDEAVRRHPAPAVPSYDAEKWQLVPKEPTDDMWRASEDLFDKIEVAFGKGQIPSCFQIYKAMLAAAPTPPTNTDELRAAAQAVVDRYKDGGDIWVAINRLREALK